MKIKSVLKYSFIGAISMTLFHCSSESASEASLDVENVTFQDSKVIEGSYIIVYNNSATGRYAPLEKVKSASQYQRQMSDLRSSFVKEFKSVNLKEDNITQTFGHALKGFTANLTEEQVSALKKDSRVKTVEPDMTISIAPYKGKPGSGNPPAQSTPYGTIRVGGGTTTSSHTAWVIDSGIDLDHEDLVVDVGRSVSFLTGGGGATSPDDQNGHGTHVAGTIGAKDNGIGSLGVAPGTTVVAVRVLDRRGSGSISGVIAGIDYVAANANPNGDVANMSLGGGVSTTLDNAVIAAASTGVIFTLAAGNESDDADNHSPARAEGANIYTISAMNSSDNWASFSNYGSHVDYCAPGVSVYSTWKDGGYNSISGTSMAAPHAAGVFLLGNPTTDGFVNNDPDGNPDPIIHN